MLDIKLIRDNPEAVKKGLAAKYARFNLDNLINLDNLRRASIQEVEKLKAQRNKANDEISALKKSGDKTAAEAVIQSIKSISQKIKEFDSNVGEIDESIAKLMYEIPNIPEKDVPCGEGASANKVVRTWGEPKKFGFKGRDHLEIAEKWGWVSMDRGSKISGSGFPVYQGAGAKLQRTLIQFMLDLHTAQHGYEEVWPPALVNAASMTGTGQLPKFEEEMYRLRDDALYLVPTAEVPVTNLFRDEILKEEELPIYKTAYSPCFRREAGSYGKDTRGLSRVHQFDKIELVKLVKPEEGAAELEMLVGQAEAVLRALELPYRVVLLGTGDLSFSAAKCYDLEVWAPGSEKWYEVSSCSWFRDFQARRINIRFRRNKTNKLELVHTLNGSGVALARTVLCLLENFQTQDGRVEFPKALRPYLGEIKFN